METLVDLLREAAVRHPDRPAVTSRSGLRRETWSYGELWRAAGAIGGNLRRGLDLTPGMRLAVWVPNSPRVVALLFGAMRAGLVLVPIDPTATPDFVRRVIATTRAPVVVTAQQVGDGLGARAMRIEDLPTKGAPPPAGAEPVAGDLAEIVFTSGTTGAPKGVMLTHRNIVTNVAASLSLVPRRPLRLVSLLPLSHMMEQTVGLFGPLTLGSTIDYPKSRHASVLLKAMQRNRVTALVLVPQALELMLRSIEREVERRGAARSWTRAHRIAARLPIGTRRIVFRRVVRSLGGHLDFVICGGARLNGEVLAAWERMGVRVLEGYGATECAPIVAANTYWDRAPGTVGRPLSGVSVRLSDEGEILVRGPNVTAGYWEDAAATSAAFDAEGHYRTGDLGRWDDNGRLVLTGRLTDRIVLASGLNVFPDDIETEVRAEPEIADCVVVGTDAGGNPRLHAVVIPAVSAGGAAARDAVGDAVRRAGARLAPHQRVAGFTIWPGTEFPRTNLLKVKRHEVAAAVTEGPVAPAPHLVSRAGAGGEPSARVKSALARVRGIDPAAITEERDLVLDLGLDSLGRVELAMILETEIGADLDEGELAEVVTVGALCDLVARRSGQPPGERFPEWPRRRPACVLRSVLQQLVLFPLHRIVAHPFVVEGRGHLEEVCGPVLVIANHASHLDTPSILRALPAGLRRRAAVAAAADYFYRWRFVGALMSLVLGTFPFSREGAVRASLVRCGELVDDGWSVIIYPEGTRSTSGAMAPYRSGIGLLVEELGVPVVPVGLLGTHTLWSKGTRVPRRGPVTVRIGEPIDVAPGADRAGVVAALESAVARLTAAGSVRREMVQSGR